MSIGGIIQRGNKKEAAAAPPAPTVTAANNGTSLSGTTVQFGQSIAAVGDPAILLNDREIVMGGFDFRMRNGANQQLLIDPAGSYKIGDISNSLGKNSFIDIDAVNAVVSTYQIDGLGSIGRFSTSNNGSFISQEDATLVYVVRAQNNNAALVSIEALNGRAQVDATHDGTNPYVKIYSQNEGVTDFLNIELFRDQLKVNAGIASVTKSPLTLLATGAFQLGEYGAGAFTGVAAYTLQVDASGNIIEGAAAGGGWGTTGTVATLTGNAVIALAGNTFGISDGAGTYFSIDQPNNTYFIGNNAAGSYVTITDAGLNSAVDLFAKNGALFAEIIVGASAEQIEVLATNGLKITGDTTLLRTGTALANGAGAAAGTLANAPTAGDPAKWISIDDNGTTRFIPTWI